MSPSIRKYTEPRVWVTEGLLPLPTRINHANSRKGGERRVARKVLAPSDLQDEKETPACAEENFVRSQVAVNSQNPGGRGLPHFPGDQRRPSAVLGKTSAVLSHSPRWSWRRTGSHLLTSAVLGRDGRPSYSPGKPRWMNELPTRPSLPGHGQIAGGLTCGDTGRLLRVRTQAGIPELEDKRQQQQLRLQGAAPHLRPPESPLQLRHPHCPAAVHFSRERGDLGPPRADDCGREPAGQVRAAERLRAAGAAGGRAAEMRPSRSRGEASASRRCGQVIGSPRGRRQGGPHSGYWPPADPPRRCGRLRSPLPAPRLGLFAQLRPI